MRIGFDAKRFFNNFTGLGNYSRFIVDALSKAHPSDELYLFSPRVRKHPEIDPLVDRSQVHVIKPPSWSSFTKTTALWRTWWQSYHPTIKALDVYHGLSHELPWALPGRIRKVVTVHDLIFLRFPELYNPIDVAIYKSKVMGACARADRVVAISHQTKMDLVDFLRVDAAKIDVVYQGVNSIFYRSCPADVKANVRSKYQLPDEYMLTVGTIEERKNAELVLRALALIPEKSRKKVVIMGRETGYKRKLVSLASELSIEPWITFLHGAAYQDFPAIYQGASVFLYPSIFEGFGIPLVEAISSGVPVITSTGSCFLEAAGPASIYIDPKDHQSLAVQIQNVLYDQSLRGGMIRESSEYIRQFLPEKIASDQRAVYASIV